MLDYDADDPPKKVEDWNDWWRSTAEYRTVFRLTLPTQLFWTLVWLMAILLWHKL